MKVINMAVTKLQPEMTLYEDVYNNQGGLILPKGTVLDKGLIRKILINRVEKAKVIVKEENDTETQELPNITSIYDKQRLGSFKKKYAQKVEEITNIIKQIGRGASINMSYVNSISKQIVDEFKSMNDIVNYMHLVRPLNDYTYSHSLNVSLIAMIIGKWLNLNEKQIDELAIAGLLHDIGKTKVSEKILEKPSRLTPEEYEEVKKHAVLGYMMVENMMDISTDVKYSILMHHEKIDGSGYPTNAKEDQIPLYAKIIAVADIYDAMTSNRSYRDSLCPFDVIKEFERETFGKLDTLVLSIFLKNIANSYLGDYVELSNGEIAEIVFINPNRVWQPIVRSGSSYIDLSQPSSDSLYIRQII
jgi:putative nucleotidyltransferase with HDIG domain